MAYKVKPTDWDTIAPIAEKLNSLKEYQSLSLKDEAQNIDRLRHVLYAWLYESGLKRNYKLIRRGPEQLEILKRGELKPVIESVDRIGDFVRDNLVELEDEADVAGRIREAISGGDLSIEEGARALTEWQRIYCKV